MKAPQAPRIDERRKAQFLAELQERARTWIPGWAFADVEGDFGHALLEIAARFDSEVSERLDGAGEKMRRGFLDWLAIRGEAARPARMPVVFKMADTATQAVLAAAPVRLQADTAGSPVIFETEKDVRVVPGRLDVVVGVDAAQDAFYLPPPGLSDLKPLEPLPVQWQLKSFAAAKATKLQLDPEAGLEVDMIIEAGGGQYRITSVDNGIVTIEPSLDSALQAQTVVRKVTTFAPFDGITRNRQEHALYIGHMDLLNIEAPATIDVIGATSLRTGITWEFWGKKEKSEEPDWQSLTVLPPDPKKSDALVLQKLNGSVEPKKIGEINSRWIRAITNHLQDPGSSFSTDALKLKINCVDPPLCPSGDSAETGPTAEAMANNTPLVLSEPFFPLGQVPRQFDAFYLGCSEAFSKKGAVAQVCFEMSDATCLVYTPVRAGLFAAQGVLAGVGKDQALHLFKLNSANGAMTVFRGPLRPPLPAATGTKPPSTTPVNLNLHCAPVIWNDPANPDSFFVAVASGGEIWMWHEDTDATKSAWIASIKIPSTPGQLTEIEDIIVFASAPSRPGAVLSNGRFWVFDGSTWTQPSQGTPLRDYACIASIYDGNLNPTDSIIAIGADKKLYRLEKDGHETLIATSTTLFGAIHPAAIDDAVFPATKLRVVAINETRDKFIAVKSGSEQTGSLGGSAKAIGLAVTIAKVGVADFEFSVSARKALDSAFIASCVPTFNAGNPLQVFQSTIPGAFGDIGSPLTVGSYTVVPGSRGDAFVAPFNPLGRLQFSKAILEGVIVSLPTLLGVGDFLSALPEDTSQERKGWTITKPAKPRGTQAIYLVDPVEVGEPLADEPELIGYFQAKDSGGTVTSNTEFETDNPDPEIQTGAILRIEVSGEAVTFCTVDSVNGTTVVVDAATPIPGSANTSLSYWKPNPLSASVTPAIEFDPLLDGIANVGILETTKLYFESPLQPAIQSANVFTNSPNAPFVLALTQRWTSTPPAPGNPTPFIIDTVRGPWLHQLGDTATNPALSWEYWNGKGWWSLDDVEDGTLRLANTGPVKFTVPSDIAESDWAGKTNFWIRVRLVGGDYGQEEVKVISTPGDHGVTEQVIERSTANIRAPQVIHLQISYSICDALLPTFVLAQDSGSILDQSDANRTDGAIVEAFVPLSLALSRLSGAKDIGRSLFIGLDAIVSEAPVNVLLLVDRENDHTAFAPMTIEALVAGRFQPIVAEDGTRALGESGVLSLSFAVPPTLSDLFGETRTWLRLTPKSADGNWLPSLRGAYLNAVFASATETLTRELVGSSDGSPNLTLRLARPPLLQNTLELRVREPLGEEERDALIKRDPNLVLSNVEGLAGDWVLWKQVIDPDDEDPLARVYALDEASGEIRFGDGIHGRIPPIGRDAIVAFHYSRTEPGSASSSTVPGNLITARTALNLVSSVESVEAVTAADQSAGGAPPESDERVLRFGFARLRHRRRAVTASDLEDLALESSPDFAQTRAIVKRGYIRLIVVMKGRNPTPNAAQVRALRRLLLAEAPLALSAPGALRIDGPKIRRLRIELDLRIETLDHAGQVSQWVKDHLATFFDSANGGIDKDGWVLGLNPTDEDIAFVLINAPNLESIAKVNLLENVGDGLEQLWPQSIRPDELVMLDDDPVRIQFETAEVAV